MKQKETKYSYLKIDGGILHCRYKPMEIIDLHISKAGIRDRIEFSEYNDYPCLFDIREAGKVTKEARDYLANEGSAYLKASALIINSPVLKMLANFFIIVNQPKIPTKIFTDPDQAVEWLSQYTNSEDSSSLNQAS